MLVQGLEKGESGAGAGPKRPGVILVTFVTCVALACTARHAFSSALHLQRPVNSC